MKRIWKKSKWLILIILFPFILFISLLLFFFIKGLTIEAKGKEEIAHYIQSINIPDDEIIILNGEQYSIGLLSIDGFQEEITTKSDYETWKQKIQETGKFYNEEIVPSNYTPKLEDCELIYTFSYNSNRKTISFVYEIAGDATGNKKIIRENFAYPNIPFDYPEE